MFKKSISILLSFMLLASFVPTAFAGTAQRDIQAHWAKEPLQKWVGQGLLSGYTDGSLKPDREMTRAEFAKLINSVFGFTASTAATFSDVKGEAWYASEVAAAREAGYISGYPDGSFKPKQPITREQAAHILAGLYQLPQAEGQALLTFKDESRVSAYAKESLAQLNASGYLQGYPDQTLRPQKSVTRAEAVTLLERMAPHIMNASGLYSGLNVNGNVVVSSQNVELRNTTVSGNIYLTAGIGEGDVSLQQVTVHGSLYVNGGGENSIHLINSTVDKVIVNKPKSPVRVVVTGSSRIKQLAVESQAVLEVGEEGTIEALELKAGAEGTTIAAKGTIKQVKSEVDQIKLNEQALEKGKSFGVDKGRIVSTPVTTPISGGGPGGGSGGGGQPTEADWTLVWSDEFDGSGSNLSAGGVNLDKWGFQNGTGAEYGLDGWGNNEQQYYTDDNVKVQDGRLIIEAKPQAMGNKPYTSGRLYTAPTFAKKYGKFEARIKLPVGQGFWPAFWMMPKDSEYGGWAASGEIDIMEAKGRLPDHVGGTIHYGGNWPNNKYMGRNYHFPEGQSIAQFHTYAVEWEPGEIRWYVDGNLYSTINNWDSTANGQPTKFAYPAPFDREFYLILNLAVGGTYDGNRLPAGSDFPAAMEVEYVRVYELTGRPYREPVEPVIVGEELPPGAKPAVNGNYIYDVGFNQPFTVVTTDAQQLNSSYWNFVHLSTFGGTGSIAAEEVHGERYARVNITGPGSQPHSIQLIQNVTLAKGRYYKVSFEAKAAASRSMTVKLGGGPDRGYAAYSNSESIALTDQFEAYEFKFQMQADSDALARLEMNMGTNGTTVWIGNVIVEETDGDLLNENGAKEPLDNGNHVYNGYFNLGHAHRMTYWNFTATQGANASAAVDTNLNQLHVNIINGGTTAEQVQLVQKGINLLQMDEYELSFEARADEARSIEAALLSENGAVNYSGVQSFNLTSAMADYQFAFTMPAGTTDVLSQLVFLLGGSSADVYLNNVSLIRKTNNNVDYSNVELFPLGNGGFDLGLDFWAPFIQGGAASFSTENGEARIAVTNRGTEAWNIMLNQEGMKFTKGLEYVLSFDARSSVQRDIEVALENAAYTRRFETGSIVLTPDAKRFEYTFKMAADDTLTLKFLLGHTSQSPAGAHQVYIDNVVLEVKDAPVKRAPTLVADQSDNKVGQPIEITFTDDAAWRGAISAVFVNNEAVAADQYTISAGTISFVAPFFALDGTYSIKVEADGCAAAMTAQQVFALDGNLLLNGSFSAGALSWTHWAGDGGASTFSVENEQAVIRIINNGGLHPEWNIPVSWSTQLAQENIKLEAGKTYELSFKARASAARPIELEYNGMPGNPKHQLLITTEDAVYTHQFTSTSASTLRLLFLLGNVIVGEATTPSEAHSLYLDDVLLREVVVAPLVQADTSFNNVGRPIALTFTDNSAWRNAIQEIWIAKQGSAAVIVNASKYSIAAGAITFEADFFTEAGAYMQGANQERALVLVTGIGSGKDILPKLQEAPNI